MKKVANLVSLLHEYDQYHDDRKANQSEFEFNQNKPASLI